MRVERAKKVVPARKRVSCLRLRLVGFSVVVVVDDGWGIGLAEVEGEGVVMFGRGSC